MLKIDLMMITYCINGGRYELRALNSSQENVVRIIRRKEKSIVDLGRKTW